MKMDAEFYKKIGDGVTSRKTVLSAVKSIIAAGAIEGYEDRLPTNLLARLKDAIKDDKLKTCARVQVTELNERIQYGLTILAAGGIEPLAAADEAVILGGVCNRLGNCFEVVSRGGGSKFIAPKDGENVEEWLKRNGGEYGVRDAVKRGFTSAVIDGVKYLYAPKTAAGCGATVPAVIES